MSDDLRNLILNAEIFSPGLFNPGFPFDSFILQIEALRSWDDESILRSMQAWFCS
jgi:hypothetical protein